MRQLFQNLIANALKFHGEEQPRIKIYSQRTDHDCQIFVEDNGIGFDETFLDRIFVLFSAFTGEAPMKAPEWDLPSAGKLRSGTGGVLLRKASLVKDRHS